MHTAAAVRTDAGALDDVTALQGRKEAVSALPTLLRVAGASSADVGRLDIDGVSQYEALFEGGNTTDERTMHAGDPVLEGEKYVFCKWIHQRPFEC